MREVDQTTPIERQMYMHNWKFKKLDKNQIIRLRRAYERHDLSTDKRAKKISSLNHLRHGNEKLYRRQMDMALFSQKLREDIIGLCENDPVIGHIAMIADFIPYALEARDDLELKLFIDDIKQKVAARRAKYRQNAA